jgi:hypothetical protein
MPYPANRIHRHHPRLAPLAALTLGSRLKPGGGGQFSTPRYIDAAVDRNPTVIAEFKSGGGPMTTQLRLLIPLFGFLATIALQSGPGVAQRHCFTDGSRPFCGGMLECPRGYERTRSTRSGCIKGHIITCCERMGFISQSQKRGCTPSRYGTPGCPYPSFGVTNRACPVGTRGIWPRCRTIRGATCGKGMTGRPPNCYPVLN